MRLIIKVDISDITPACQEALIVFTGCLAIISTYLKQMVSNAQGIVVKFRFQYEGNLTKLINFY